MSSVVNNGNGEGLFTIGLEDTHCSLDELMNIAYSNKVLYCDGGPCDPVWCQHWSIIVQCMGQHYSLHGSSFGKKYIDLLCVELQHLSLGTYLYHSEQVIVFLFCDATIGRSCA